MDDNRRYEELALEWVKSMKEKEIPRKYISQIVKIIERKLSQRCSQAYADGEHARDTINILVGKS